MTYLIEVRDSDGNDCDVFDVLVEAPDRDSAYEAVDKWIMAAYPDDETYGGFGTYHPCDCECEHAGHSKGVCEECCDRWECNHGGILVNEEPEVFPTYQEAIDNHAKYHLLIELDTVVQEV